MRRLVFLLIFLSFNLFASEVIYLGKSPKALLMGDAYTSIAEDNYTLFYNPAGLGRNKGLYFNLINFQLGVTNALKEVDRFSDMSSSASEINRRFQGFPIYLKMATSPTLKLSGFAITPIVTTNWKMELDNPVHPALNIDYRYDKGFIVGYAHTFGKGGRDPITAKMKAGVKASFGVSVKHLRREGLQGSFDLYGTNLLNIIESGISSTSDLRESLGFATGKGWGVDLGYQQVWSTNYTEMSVGASILDVGGTKFRKVAGAEGRTVPEQEMLISAGAAIRQDFKILDYTLAVDLKPLNQDLDFGRKLHIGAKIGVPLIDFFGGWSEGHISYGIEAKFWPVTLTAGFYGVELGQTFKQEEGQRLVVQLQLFDIDLDL